MDAHERSGALSRSFAWAWSGLSYVYRTQRNMRIHVALGALAGGVCIVLGVSRVEVLMVVLAVAGVLIAEVANTVAEALTDLMEPQLNPVAKVTKDVAAAGVLLGALFSVLIGFLVFYPALWELPVRLAGFVEHRVVYFGLYCLLAIVPSLAGLALPDALRRKPRNPR